MDQWVDWRDASHTLNLRGAHMADQGGQAVSVFISYRREGGFYLAKNIHDHLKQCGYDVFMDIHQLGAGEFEKTTMAEIRSRDYFVIVLTKGSLNRLRDPNDWLRKEIQTARDADRRIIPVLDVDFSFGASEVRDVLAAAPKAIREIAGFNAVNMPRPEYFEDGLKRLRGFLRENPPAVTAPPARSGELREAERHLEKHSVPSPRTLTKEELTAHSWHELDDRFSDHSQWATETYTKAIEQLGHDQALVRLGAVYSLEQLAQDKPPRRQAIVDVLCAYLRMPYPLPPVESQPRITGTMSLLGWRGRQQPGAPRPDPAQELEVRQSAQRLLADHLRRPSGLSHEDVQRIKASPDEAFWPGIRLNLTGATLVDFDLSRISVIGASFTKATFSGAAMFDGATFSGAAMFDEATFSGAAMFTRATFSGDAMFTRATFSGAARFHGATFSGDARFLGATFSDDAMFTRATFSGAAGFLGATFSDDAMFDEATFYHFAMFTRATFSGAAGFTRAAFSDAAMFDEATFSNAAGFHGATFSHAARFDEVRVLGLDHLNLNKGGENAYRVWPEGWTVYPDADDPSRGTLVFTAAGAH
jgi:uncharacterized protein YjbI with pentapeptide repeats